MNIWLVSREYAGIAEAGGVKNVACSLSENLVRLGHDVTLFIPFYGCTSLSKIDDYDDSKSLTAFVQVKSKEERVEFSHGTKKGVRIVFVHHPSFLQKKAVYTYTQEEEQCNPAHKKGHGHEDSISMNIIFQKSVVAYSKFAVSCPDVIHCQDAATALVSCFARQISYFDGTKFAVTIHNAGPAYHHEFKSIDQAAEYTGLDRSLLETGLNGGCVEPFLLASRYACLTTVSPEYADEILSGKTDTQGLSECLNKLGVRIVGITNGIEFENYDPVDTSKSRLPFAFNPFMKDFDGKIENRKFFLENFAAKSCLKSNASKGLDQFGYIDFSDGEKVSDYVYIAYHGRVVSQKGIDVMVTAVDQLLSNHSDLKLKFLFVGQGDSSLEDSLAGLAGKFKGSVVYLKGYEKLSARLCVASADFSLHPSYFEPCGLEDFIAQTFGTIPVAHSTGGLCKIVDEETGFLYSPNTPDVLSSLLASLVKLMNYGGREMFVTMISYAFSYVHKNYSWTKIASKYIDLFNSIKL